MKAIRKCREAEKTSFYLNFEREDTVNLTCFPLGFNENIAKEHFHICGATGLQVCNDCVIIVIAYAAKAHVHIQALIRKKEEC